MSADHKFESAEDSGGGIISGTGRSARGSHAARIVGGLHFDAPPAPDCHAHHFGCECRQQYVHGIERRVTQYRDLLEEVRALLVSDLPANDHTLDRLMQRIRTALEN